MEKSLFCVLVQFHSTCLLFFFMWKLIGLWSQRAPFKLVPSPFDMTLGFDSYQWQTVLVHGVINRHSSKNGHFIQDLQILSLKKIPQEWREGRKRNKTGKTPK